MENQPAAMSWEKSSEKEKRKDSNTTCNHDNGVDGYKWNLGIGFSDINCIFFLKTILVEESSWKEIS